MRHTLRHGGDTSPMMLSKSAGYSAWNLFRFGLLVGTRTLRIAPRKGIKRLILPVDYIRYVEFQYVLEHLDLTAKHVILDIGSPKLLSLFLADRVGARVYATDILDNFFDAYGCYAAALGVDPENYVMETQDARTLSYASDTFDRVFSVSAIEHIPDDGDSAAMREIFRVLKPGGICCLTVPWSDSGYAEMFKRRGDPDAYWVDSDEDAVFYQRLYDRPALECRLLNNHDFETLDISFWGERKIAIEEFMSRPQALRLAMLPLHFPLSRLFLEELTEQEPSRKKVACLALRKRHR